MLEMTLAGATAAARGRECSGVADRGCRNPRWLLGAADKAGGSTGMCRGVRRELWEVLTCPAVATAAGGTLGGYGRSRWGCRNPRLLLVGPAVVLGAGGATGVVGGARRSYQGVRREPQKLEELPAWSEEPAGPGGSAGVVGGGRRIEEGLGETLG